MKIKNLTSLQSLNTIVLLDTQCLKFIKGGNGSNNNPIAGDPVTVRT